MGSDDNNNIGWWKGKYILIKRSKIKVKWLKHH